MTDQQPSDTNQPSPNEFTVQGLEVLKAFAAMTGGKIQAIRYVSPHGTRQIDPESFTIIDEEPELVEDELVEDQEESIEDALRQRKIELFKETQSKIIQNLQQRISSLTESGPFDAQDVFILCEAMKASLYILDNAEDCFA